MEFNKLIKINNTHTDESTPVSHWVHFGATRDGMRGKDMKIQTKTGLIFDPNDSRCQLLKKGNFPNTVYFVKCIDKRTGHIHFYFGTCSFAKTEAEYIQEIMERGNNVYELLNELKDVIPN